MVGLSKQQIEQLIASDSNHRCEPYECCVRLVAIAELPSRFGEFQACGFVSPCDGKEHVALIKGDIIDREDVLTRVHSECLTGDVMGSRRCDCRAQLIESLRRIEQEGLGVLLYLRQEGRNIGLADKIRAYALQDQGYDTIDANLLLGHGPDERDYGVAAHMLRSLRIRSIRLMTNNPNKVEQLKTHGVKITSRVPLVIQADQYNRYYLETKRLRAGHLLDEVGQVRSIDLIDL